MSVDWNRRRINRAHEKFLTKGFWQDVFIDSRKVSKKKALNLVNRKVRKYGFQAVEAKVDDKHGTWTGTGYVVPYKVRVIPKINKTTGVLE